MVCQPSKRHTAGADRQLVACWLLLCLLRSLWKLPKGPRACTCKNGCAELCAVCCGCMHPACLHAADADADAAVHHQVRVHVQLPLRQHRRLARFQLDAARHHAPWQCFRLHPCARRGSGGPVGLPGAILVHFAVRLRVTSMRHTPAFKAGAEPPLTMRMPMWHRLSVACSPRVAMGRHTDVCALH